MALARRVEPAQPHVNSWAVGGLAITCSLLSFLGDAPPSFAQPAASARYVRSEPPPFYSILSVDNGLASNDVQTILRDRAGYVWFGTQRGISRYDGYRFDNLFPSPFEVTPGEGFSGGWVYDMMEARDGGIWIGSATGLHRYDPRDGTVENLRHLKDVPGAVSSLAEGPDGSLWLGVGFANSFGGNYTAWGDGLFRMDPSDRSMTRFGYESAESDGLRSQGVMGVEVDERGRVWVATTSVETLEFGRASLPPTADWSRAVFWEENGLQKAGVSALSRLDPASGRLLHLIPTASQATVITSDSLRGLLTTLHLDPSGMLWIGTSQGYGWLDTREDIPQVTYVHLGRDVGRLSEGLQGRLWLSTELGLEVVDRASRRTNPFPHHPILEAGPRTPVLEDPSGILWFRRGESDGVVKLRPEGGLVATMPFDSRLFGQQVDMRAQCFAEDRSGRLWVGTNRGLIAVSGETGEMEAFRHNPSDPQSLSDEDIWDLHVDSENRLWLATTGRLNWMDLDRPGVFEQPDSRMLETVGSRTVRSISETSDGTLWFGLDAVQGLIRADASTLSTRWYRGEEGDDSSLGWGTVAKVLEDARGVVWVVGWNIGLNRWNPDSETFTRYGHDPRDPGSLISMQIASVAQVPGDPDHLWLAVQEGGLSRFDTKSGRAEHFMRSNGRFPDDVVWAVSADDEGMLWTRTGRGVVRFDPATQEFAVFDAKHGLTDYWAHAGGQLLASTGELLLSRRGGISAIDVHRPAANGMPPIVHVTDVRVDGESIRATAGEIPTPMDGIGTVDLSHDQNSLSFSYVGLHYGDSESNTYRVLLENHDEKWREMGRQREATYANLAPGSYRFHVQSANSDGVWSESDTSLSIVIHPPWWRTFWAYGFYVLVLASGVFGVDRLQRRRLVAAERERTRERDLAQAREIERQHTELTRAHDTLKATQAQLLQSEKLASLGQLTSGIAHELKNPLNFVNNFAEVNEEMAAQLKGAIRQLQGGASPSNVEDLEDLAASIRMNSVQIARHGKRADAIVASMMAHATAGSGERVLVDVNDFVAEYVRFAGGAFSARRPDVEVRIEEGYDPVVRSMRMAPQELGKALVNILSNAFDAVAERRRGDRPEGAASAAPEGPRSPGEASLDATDPYVPTVTITTHRRDAGIEIRIADNGPGLPSAIRDRIFEPFFTTKPTGEGTGLGLSLAHDIVVQGHGGTLGVESEEGNGATFVIALPDGRSA